MATKKMTQSTLSFIVNSGSQESLTFEQEKQLGLRVQAGLKFERLHRYHDLLNAQETLDSDERKEMDELALEFGNSINDYDWSSKAIEERKAIIADGYEARNDLVLHNIKLVVFVAKRYDGYKMETAELVQEGIIGCFRAAEKYDPERGFRFSTCAVPWINQEIYRFVQQGRKTIRLPAHVVEGISKINRIIEQYSQDHEGAEPTNEEIAALSDGKLTVENVDLYRRSANSITSLNMVVGDEEDTELGDLIEDETEPSPDSYVTHSELHDILMRYVNELPEIQQKIIIMRYALDGSHKEYTLEEVGAKLGFTRERIRQLEADALLTIRVRAQRNHDLDWMY